MKSGTTPSSLSRQEKNNAYLNAKNTESTNGELELQSSSNAASSIEIRINSMGDQVNHNTTMCLNDTEHNFGSEKREKEGKFKGQTDTKPLKIFAKRYSTKRYKQHHVEEMKIEFCDEDSSSSDEDDLDA